MAAIQQASLGVQIFGDVIFCAVVLLCCCAVDAVDAVVAVLAAGQSGALGQTPLCRGLFDAGVFAADFAVAHSTY